MRLIDADTLKQELQWCLEQSSDTDRWRDVIERVDAVPTVEPNREWISVKDRLPKSMANKVLVWLEHEDLVGYIGFGHYEKYKGQEIWYDLEHNEPFENKGYTVTHWHALPEPPKMEGGEMDE